MGHNWGLQWGECRGDIATGTLGKAMAQSQLLCATFTHYWALPAWHEAFGEPRLQRCIHPSLCLSWSLQHQLLSQSYNSPQQQLETSCCCCFLGYCTLLRLGKPWGPRRCEKVYLPCPFCFHSSLGGSLQHPLPPGPCQD